ncbi:hypothetical protein AVEN_129563-1 [Araneus ventricosus]|uniref:Uncharacterized protein n=1 Tax=Araneus ventricosus TaxID=182803 RepID=A0A4Y2MNU6_ARAVE|nr:hypothetical protein AVEN_129563-1 [Araneus ventricosus]
MVMSTRYRETDTSGEAAPLQSWLSGGDQESEPGTTFIFELTIRSFSTCFFAVLCRYQIWLCKRKMLLNKHLRFMSPVMIRALLSPGEIIRRRPGEIINTVTTLPESRPFVEALH